MSPDDFDTSVLLGLLAAIIAGLLMLVLGLATACERSEPEAQELIEHVEVSQ